MYSVITMKTASLPEMSKNVFRVVSESPGE